MATVSILSIIILLIVGLCLRNTLNLEIFPGVVIISFMIAAILCIIISVIVYAVAPNETIEELRIYNDIAQPETSDYVFILYDDEILKVKYDKIIIADTQYPYIVKKIVSCTDKKGIWLAPIQTITYILVLPK